MDVDIHIYEIYMAAVTSHGIEYASFLAWIFR